MSIWIKRFGLLISAPISIISYLLSYALWEGFIYNGLSVEWNLTSLMAFVVSFLILTKRYYAKHQKTIVLLFVIAVFIVQNLSLSVYVDLTQRLNDYEYDSNDMSWVIILPLTFLTMLAWGWAFDTIKNRIAVITHDF